MNGSRFGPGRLLPPPLLAGPAAASAAGLAFLHLHQLRSHP